MTKYIKELNKMGDKEQKPQPSKEQGSGPASVPNRYIITEDRKGGQTSVTNSFAPPSRPGKGGDSGESKNRK